MIEWNFTSGEAPSSSKPRKKGAFPPQLIDGARQPPLELVLEKAAAIAREQPVISQLHRLGPAHQPRAQTLHPTSIEPAAPMRRRDENHPAHARQRLDQERLPKQAAVGGFSRELVKRPVAHVPPEATAAVDDRHLGQQAPHAVPDQNHPVE